MQERPACIALAVTDAYDEYEKAAGWMACIEAMFERFDRVLLLREEVKLRGFDLADDIAVVAICEKGRKRVRVALEDVEFPEVTTNEALRLTAWRVHSRSQS